MAEDFGDDNMSVDGDIEQQIGMEFADQPDHQDPEGGVQLEHPNAVEGADAEQPQNPNPEEGAPAPNAEEGAPAPTPQQVARSSRRKSIFFQPEDRPQVDLTAYYRVAPPDAFISLAEAGGADLDPMLRIGYNTGLAALRVQNLREYVTTFRQNGLPVEDFCLPNADRYAVLLAIEFMLHEDWTKVHLTDQELIQVVDVADAMGYLTLFRYAVNELQQRITYQNAVLLYQMAKELGLSGLAEFISGWVKKDPTRTLLTGEIFANDINQATIAELLRMSDVVFSSEINVFDVMKRIVSRLSTKPEKDLRPEDFRRYADDSLIRAVRITRMQSEEIVAHIQGVWIQEKDIGRYLKYSRTGRKNLKYANIAYNLKNDVGHRRAPKIFEKDVQLAILNPDGSLSDSIPLLIEIRADICGFGEAAAALIFGGTKRQVRIRRDGMKIVGDLGDSEDNVAITFGPCLISGGEKAREDQAMVFGPGCVALRVESLPGDEEDAPYKRYHMEIGLDALAPLSADAEVIGVVSRGTTLLKAWADLVKAREEHLGFAQQVVADIGGHQGPEIVLGDYEPEGEELIHGDIVEDENIEDIVGAIMAEVQDEAMGEEVEGDGENVVGGLEGEQDGGEQVDGNASVDEDLGSLLTEDNSDVGDVDFD